MSLATHIVFAAAVTKPLLETRSPLLIFVVAFVSHFVIDAIPHFDYKLSSVKDDDSMQAEIERSYKAITKDILNIGVDVLIGSIILFAVYSLTTSPFPALTFLIVILGAVLPDALQALYWLFKNSPIKYLQRLHLFIHANTKIKSLPLGIGTQLALIAISVLAIIKL